MPSGPWEPFVRDTLQRAKDCVSRGKYTIQPRKDYLLLMEQYGLTITDQEKVIRSLTMDDFWGHSVEDRTGEHDIWEFKPTYLGIRMYVKFMIINIDGEYAVFISAHPDLAGR